MIMIAETVQADDRWLAIEIIRSGAHGTWNLEITTDEMRSITWPVPFDTPDQALEVAKETIHQIGLAKLRMFARSAVPAKH